MNDMNCVDITCVLVVDINVIHRRSGLQMNPYTRNPASSEVDSSIDIIKTIYPFVLPD
jgi:hypothetical protein